MHLSDHDLQQLDEDYLRGLSPEQLQSLSGKLLANLKEVHDRLNQNPSLPAMESEAKAGSPRKASARACRRRGVGATGPEAVEAVCRAHP
ncbi:MAG: hypothetical protein WAT23_12615, partial [Chromatiaceae bacterium]